MKQPLGTEQITADTRRARLHFVLVIILCCMGLLLNGGAAVQEITAFSGNGTLSWTNGLTNGAYEVQWSSSLAAGGAWTNDWSQLRGIQGTQSVFTVPVPMFYRVKGSAYPEVTDSAECYARYSNALLNAAVALPEEISTRLRPVTTNTLGTDWRTFTNWVDGTTNRWIRVATMKFTGSWAWNSLLSPGAHTMSNGWSGEIWVTLYPDARQLLAGYTGTNRTLRMEKALGLPPRPGTYGVAEFYVDPKYLFRPAVSPDIRSPSCGLVAEETSPYLAANALQGVSPGYAAGSRLPSTREATRPPTSITVGPGPGWDTPVTMRTPRTARWGSASTWCPVAATPTTGDPAW